MHHTRLAAEMDSNCSSCSICNHGSMFRLKMLRGRPYCPPYPPNIPSPQAGSQVSSESAMVRVASSAMVSMRSIVNIASFFSEAMGNYVSMLVTSRENSVGEERGAMCDGENPKRN